MMQLTKPRNSDSYFYVFLFIYSFIVEMELRKSVERLIPVRKNVRCKTKE